MERLYLFGASNYGKEVYEKLKSKYNICGFIDNDSKKLGGGIDNISIISPHQLKNLNNYHILITSDYADEISIQLETMNITNFSLYPCLEFYGDMDYANKNLCRKIDLATYKLFSKLKKIEISKLDISEYNICYLNKKNLNQIFIYSQILYHILSENININNFLDYGGGTGLLSLLAIECGVPNVFYNDIYNISCRDAETIAKELEYQRQGYIEGDIKQVIEYSQSKNVLFDAVVSYDVIEHIFDLNSFYMNLKNILNTTNVICMASGANSFNHNFLENAYLGHLKVEFLNRKKVFGHKERDNLQAYFNIRIDTIKKYLKSVNYSISYVEIIGLSFLTRGLMINDVKEAVDNYINRGEIPRLDTFFEYNTCDPYTGNWAEHIIDFRKLKEFLETTGFETSLLFVGNPEDSHTIQVKSKYTKNIF